MTFPSPPRRLLSAFALLLLPTALAPARTIDVANSDALRRAAASAQPGDTIRLAPGTYAPGNTLPNLHGTPDHPITIEAADPAHPPLFQGGTEALHFPAASYLTLRHLACTNQSGNGINIDDAGHLDHPAHHITLEHITVTDTGTGPNALPSPNPIKLSGVDDFTLRHITTQRWGGSSIDLVGCHHGLIEDCTFGTPPTTNSRESTTPRSPTPAKSFHPATGPQIKGGSSDITLRHCSFPHTAERAINIGGSTGLPYFRPPDAPYEAHNITIEGCTFIGATTPLAFVGVDTATARYNTIYLPDKWILRLLQESTGPRFAPCRNVTLDHNLIIFRSADCPTPLNLGPHTAPETSTFTNNFWFCQDNPAKSPPTLPTPEHNGTYGQDPHLSPTTVTPPKDSPASHYGASALPAADR